MTGAAAVNASDRMGFDYAGREWFIEQLSFEKLRTLHEAGAIDSLEFERDEIEWLANDTKVRCFYKISFVSKSTASDFESFRITMFR